jgi:hypothetical protein
MIEPAGSLELLMGSLLNYPALIDEENGIGSANAGESV